MRQYSKRRPKKAQGWGSPTGGIPYSHYRSLGGFFAPGDEPKDCPEEQTLIRAMIDLNREIGGKTITPRKARAIYEDCRSKDKENNKKRFEIDRLNIDAKLKQGLIDDIDAKIIFKKDTKTDLTSGYPARDQRVSHGIDPRENDPDHVKNARRQRYKHTDGMPKEELLCEIWLLDFLAGEEDCERADAERHFESNRRRGALEQCKVKGWWRGQNGRDPDLSDIRRYQTIGGAWIGPTNDTDTEYRWQEYMPFYGPMPLLKRRFDAIHECPIIEWTIDRAVELGLMDENAVDDPYEWAKAYLNRALNCVQVEAHKCFRKVNGYLCGRQYYIPGTYRWLGMRYDALGFLSLPDLWDGADAEKILAQAIACGDVLMWGGSATVVDANGVMSFRDSSINNIIGIDKWNYGCEVWEIQRQKVAAWNAYATTTFERLERKVQERKEEVARIKAEKEAEIARIQAEEERAAEEQEQERLSTLLEAMANPEHDHNKMLRMLPSARNLGSMNIANTIQAHIAFLEDGEEIELSSLDFCDIADRAVELGLIVLDEKESTHRGTDWKPQSSGFATVKATTKKPTLVE